MIAGDVGSPDYVVVSEPGGSVLAPDRCAVGIGCRGFAALDIRVSTFADELSCRYSIVAQ